MAFFDSQKITVVVSVKIKCERVLWRTMFIDCTPKITSHGTLIMEVIAESVVVETKNLYWTLYSTWK